MADAAKDQDQSMEDILQSIKRIIAEEGDPVEAASTSDVLELTEQLAEDGSISQIKPDETPAVASISLDEIMAAPISPPEPEPLPEPAIAPAEPDPVEPVAAEAAPTAVVEPSLKEDTLMSGATLSASVAALNALRDSMAPVASSSHATVFRSGTTVEDLVVESLKPMLKEWLDANLPSMVEALVKREISRLTQS